LRGGGGGGGGVVDRDYNYFLILSLGIYVNYHITLYQKGFSVSKRFLSKYAFASPNVEKTLAPISLLV
jgi:hypothetical protein